MFLGPNPDVYRSQQYSRAHAPPPSFPVPAVAGRSTLPITPTYDHAPHLSGYNPPFPVPAITGRSTLPITPTYDHAPHLSGHNPPFPVPEVPVGPPSTLPITPTNLRAPSFPLPARVPPITPTNDRAPSFPLPAVPGRHSHTNWGRPPPPAPPPIVQRAATPVHSNTASSLPYEMDPPNAMPSPSRPGVVGGPQTPAQEWSYRASTAAEFPTLDTYNIRLTVDVLDFDEHPGIARRQLTENRREAPQRMQPPELLRCMLCRSVVSRAEAESRRWYCTGGHMGQWQLVIILLFLYETNNLANNSISSCPVIVGVHNNTTKIVTSFVNVFTIQYGTRGCEREAKGWKDKGWKDTRRHVDLSKGT